MELWKPWGMRGIYGTPHSEPSACGSLQRLDCLLLQTPNDSKRIWNEWWDKYKKKTYSPHLYGKCFCIFIVTILRLCYGICVDTCIRGGASSACRIDLGVCWGCEADRWHRIQGRPEETAADVTAGEPQHCTSSTGASEENTARNTAHRDQYLILKTKFDWLLLWLLIKDRRSCVLWTGGWVWITHLLCQCHQAPPLGSVLLFLPSLWRDSNTLDS